VSVQRWAGRAAVRKIALGLFLSMLPTLTYFGHWPEVYLDIPGTGLVLGLPGSGAHAHTPTGAEEDGAEGAHRDHCHAESASCSDVPFTGVSAFAMVNRAIAVLGATGMLTLLAVRWWKPVYSHPLVPELQPPRRFATS